MTTTVFASFATTDFTPSVLDSVVAAVAASCTYVNVNATSSAVKAVPSDHLTPVRSFHVTVVKSADTPAFATVGISAARPLASGFPSGPYDASGSRIRRDASLSLVPVAWCGLRIVGACQYRMFSCPPSPRLNAAPPEAAAEPPADGPGLLVVVPVWAHAAARMTALKLIANVERQRMCPSNIRPRPSSPVLPTLVGMCGLY